MGKAKKGKSKSKSKQSRGKKAKMGRKSKSRRPKTGRKGKMRRKSKTGRKKAKKGPQRRGKNRRKPVRKNERDESEGVGPVIPECLKPAVKYLGQIAGVVQNFDRQLKRAYRHMHLMAKKNNKTEIFLKVAEVLVEAGGGNVANLTCPGGDPPTAVLNDLVGTLLQCPAKVNDSCGPQSYFPLPNMTLVDFCVILTDEFSDLVEDCVAITKNSSWIEACECWDDPYLAELSGMLSECLAFKEEQQAITAQKDVCVEVFSDCKVAEDESVSAVAECLKTPPTLGELLKEVGLI